MCAAKACCSLLRRNPPGFVSRVVPGPWGGEVLTMQETVEIPQEEETVADAWVAT
ncbi:hypothetical protein GCM10010499_34690 [Streptomyces thermoviolaceus subsp. apingens]|nr:hypothetical protein GCM10010499_34690 [Streptomyces thermoviolaceus subsp. apingens]